MKRSTRLHRFLVAAAVAVAAVSLIAQLAYAGPAVPWAPEQIQVQAGNKMFLVGHAEGVQIYTCVLGPSGYGWQFDGPRADVFGENGKLIMTHFGGPTWEARDGSYVVAQRVDGVTVDSTAISWLLLSAASTTAGPDGDRLAGTTFIQRINTTGGVAPAAELCNAGTAGTTEEVPYTADYTFWKAAD